MIDQQAYLHALSEKKNINLNKYRKTILSKLDSDDEDLSGILPEKSTVDITKSSVITDKSHKDYYPDKGLLELLTLRYLIYIIYHFS